jgi:hypothetical protein
MTRRLPQAAFPILAGPLLKDRCERGWEMLASKVGDLAAGELAESVSTFSSAFAWNVSWKKIPGKWVGMMT